MSLPVPAKSDTATLASVSDTDSSTTLKAANANRIGLIVHNNSTEALYIAYAATATTSAGGYSYKLAAGAHWEMPQPIYTGLVTGIWAANASGAASVTELT